MQCRQSLGSDAAAGAAACRRGQVCRWRENFDSRAEGPAAAVLLSSAAAASSPTGRSLNTSLQAQAVRHSQHRVQCNCRSATAHSSAKLLCAAGRQAGWLASLHATSSSP